MHKGTLVIIDDDRSFVEAISIYLQDYGLRTIPAFSGREGLAWLQGNHADLAIVDVHMPDISGTDLAERLRRMGKDIPLILISSDDCPEVRERCKRAGVRWFLPKPLAPAELLDTIFKTLNSSS